MSVADELQALNDNILAAYTTVSDKGGTVPTDKNTDNLADAIDSIPSGGSPTPVSDLVVFIDLDGNVVETWEVSSLASKTALPANPAAPSGLTAKGWNWTLQELQAENRPMVVGQIYAPTDGKTHLFVEVDADHLTPNLAIGLNGTAIVDWGDGSATTTFTGSNVDAGQNSFHTYSQAGSYDVTIEIPAGSIGKVRGNTAYVSFLWKGVETQSSVTEENRIYGAQLKKLWLGERISIGNGGLSRLGLTEIVIPDYYPGTDIGTNYMYLCTNYMKPVILPRAITTIPQNFMSAVLSTYNSFVSLPPTVTTIGEGFLRGSGDQGLFNQPLTIPSSVTSIGGFFLVGQKAFDQPLTIPSSVTSIGGYFMQYCSLFNQPLTIPSSVTSIGNYFLGSCSLFNQPLTIPSSVTSIGGYFMQYCYSFNQPLTIPSSVTSIGQNFMSSCSLFNQPLTIPSSVTSIGGYFMSYCSKLSAVIVDTVNSPSDNYSLSMAGPNVKAYADGIVVKGVGRSAWLTNLPNLAGPQYRKLIDGGE